MPNPNFSKWFVEFDSRLCQEIKTQKRVMEAASSFDKIVHMSSLNTLLSIREMSIEAWKASGGSVKDKG